MRHARQLAFSFVLFSALATFSPAAQAGGLSHQEVSWGFALSFSEPTGVGTIPPLSLPESIIPGLSDRAHVIALDDGAGFGIILDAKLMTWAAIVPLAMLDYGLDTGGAVYSWMFADNLSTPFFGVHSGWLFGFGPIYVGGGPSLDLLTLVQSTPPSNSAKLIPTSGVGADLHVALNLGPLIAYLTTGPSAQLVWGSDPGGFTWKWDTELMIDFYAGGAGGFIVFGLPVQFVQQEALTADPATPAMYSYARVGAGVTLDMGAMAEIFD
jgi:hypothetical protein